MGNFNFNSMPNEYFHFEEDPQYESEKEVFDILQTEALNIFGTPCIYYIVSHDAQYDPIFGEDDNRRVERKFPVKMHFNFGNDEHNLSIFGIENLAQYDIYCSMSHFEQASKVNISDSLFPPNTSAPSYESYEPIEGDLIYTTHDNRWWEIVDAGNDGSFFHDKRFTYLLTVKSIRNERLRASPSTSADMPEIEDLRLKIDEFETRQNQHLDTEADKVNYQEQFDEQPSRQKDLGGWWDRSDI